MSQTSLAKLLQLARPCLAFGIAVVVIASVAGSLGVLETEAGHFGTLSAARVEHTLPFDITIVVVSDEQFFKSFEPMTQTQKCYAEQHGYKWFGLDPQKVAPACVQRHGDFFFRKHCAVATWLESQPANAAALVLDGDVIGGTSAMSLHHWLEDGSDLVFYERVFSYEITGGIYMVRNTPFGRAVLRQWADFDKVRPAGFSSSDNGALHQLVLDVIRLKGRERCREMYTALTAGVDNQKPYYAYVACTRRLLGPPRQWPAKAETGDTGYIAIWPRYWGPCSDFVLTPDARYLAPFYHGVKDVKYLQENLLKGKREDDCVVWPTGSTRAEFLQALRTQDDNDVHFTNDGDIRQTPRWPWWPPDCEKHPQGCRPAAFDEVVDVPGCASDCTVGRWTFPGRDE